MKTIVSLVSNPGTTDARVMKQARSLARAGNRVYIYGRLAPGFPAYEHISDSIQVYRFDCYSENLDKTEKFKSTLLPGGAGLVELFSPYLTSYFKSACTLNNLIPERKVIISSLEKLNDDINKMKGERKKLLKELNLVRKDLVSILSLRYWTYQQFKRRRHVKEIFFRFDSLCSEIEIRKESRKAFKEELIDFDKRNNRAKCISEMKDQLFFCRYFFYASNLLDSFGDISPDVIHSHDLHPLLGAVLISQKTGAKVIYDAHEIEVERVPPLPDDKKNFIDGLERNLFKKINHIITVCNFAVNFYHDRFEYCRPTLVMNTPEINMEKYNNAPFDYDIRALAGLGVNEKVIVYVGGVGREPRGLDKLVMSLTSLKDFHLVVIGPRHEGNDNWLKAIAERFNVMDRIHMLQGVSSDLVVPAISSANIGVCLIQDESLSYRYSMPNKLFEMAFAGVPIVVSNLPEMSEFVKEFNVGVVVDQTSPDDISNGINNIYYGRSALSDFSDVESSLNKKYSWSAQEDNLLKAYSLVLD